MIFTFLRQYTIFSVLGIPGSIIACYLVEITRGKGRFKIGGRKYSMALATALTGIFLFLFTTAKDAQQTLAYSCVTSLTQNAVSYTSSMFDFWSLSNDSDRCTVW